MIRKQATRSLSFHSIHAGFTLVELLIVIGIMALLIQLLLPAVQSSRERARQLTCQNHLRQLGIATQLHIDTQGFLPSGGWSSAYIADPSRGYGREQPGGWAFSLLYYTEQTALVENASGEDIEIFPLGMGLTQLYQSAPQIFYCPSRRVALPYPFKVAGNARWSLSVAQGVLTLSGVTKLDYAANSGDALYSAAEAFTGETHMWIPDDYKALKEQ